MDVLPITGFLGTGAPFAADLNLAAQIAMGAALVFGAALARRKRYGAHATCQTTILVLNLVMIGLVMWPSFLRQVIPSLAKGIGRSYFLAAEIHGVLGILAEMVGLYIVLVARTKVLPSYLCFHNWKRWMRFELVLWWVVILSGVATYYRWYIAPFR